MVTKKQISGGILYMCLLAFILFVIYILHINQEVFYTAYDRSEFLYGSVFFNTLISKPFGLMQYVGAWFTQLFYYPALGSTVLAAIWFLICIVGAKAFRLKGSAVALMLLPVACLLLSVVDLGYWIYVSPIRGYWFSQSIGYLIMLLLLWIARCTPRKWHLVWYLLAAALYPVLGWFSLLFILCLAVVEKLSWRELIGIVLILFTAGICHNLLYPYLKSDDVILAGLPRFITAGDFTDHLSYPFWILGLVSVLIPLVKKSCAVWYAPIVCTAIGIASIWSFMYSNKNYTDEMRAVRLAENENWKEVLNLVTNNPTPTKSLILLKNLALMNEGGLLEKGFTIGSDGVNIYNPDTVHASFLEIASPVVYYNYGLMNEAIRLNFECAVQTGFCPFYLKSLARCTKATGEIEQSEHYAKMVRHMLFNSNWQPASVPSKTSELQMSYPDELTGVENTDSYLVNSLSMWYESDDKLASEQALFYSMQRCDSRRFWKALRKYLMLHVGETFPLHAQEAYIIYLDKSPEKKRLMVPVEQSVYDRYKQFWSTLEELAKSGTDKNAIKQRMQKAYGDTYWYYNIFGYKVI